MLDWFYHLQLFIATVVALLTLVLGLAKRKPSALSIGVLALVELALVIQLIISIVLVVVGERARQDTVEFFAYLIVALMIPAAAVFWALLERSRWSTVVLAVSAFTVAVMLVRMSQIWTGTY